MLGLRVRERGEWGCIWWTHSQQRARTSVDTLRLTGWRQTARLVRQRASSTVYRPLRWVFGGRSRGISRDMCPVSLWQRSIWAAFLRVLDAYRNTPLQPLKKNHPYIPLLTKNTFLLTYLTSATNKTCKNQHYKIIIFRSLQNNNISFFTK